MRLLSWRSKLLRVLVVDDDPEILGLLKRGLIFEGYAVTTASDGREALARARDEPPDVVILDILMPGVDGLEVCRRLRLVGDIPILLLTARDTVPDKVAGLDSGADDYVVKPFAFDEILARLRAILRRRQPAGAAVCQFGDLTIDSACREVRRAGTLIELTSKEFDLLDLFMRHPRQVLTRDLIYEKVWGYDFGGESNIIEVYISYLRSKLEINDLPKLIHTVRGVGYVLKE